MAVKQRPGVLPLKFVVIGTGIAGLSAAISLCKAGHRVIVLEKEASLDHDDSTRGGCRMTPNITSILHKWGLQEKLDQISVRSKGISLMLFDSGEHLGKYRWQDEVMKELGADFAFVRYADLKRLLYETALEQGASFYFSAPVADLDPYAARIVLESGQSIHCDVIVGADGVDGLTRKLMIGSDFEIGRETAKRTTIISKEMILTDPDLAYLYKHEYGSMLVWMGKECFALGFHAVGFLILLTFQEYLIFSGGKGLQKLARLVPSPPTCVTTGNRETLEEWITGRLVIIGNAAHPLPPTSPQSLGLSIEDGAALARQFSRVRYEKQIEDFLSAFEDIRIPRSAAMHAKETGIVQYMSMQPSEEQEFRDQLMRARRDCGTNPYSVSFMSRTNCPEWVDMVEIYGYCVDDAVDDWWAHWGMLNERARGTTVLLGNYSDSEASFARSETHTEYLSM
ncbi:FAD/NAD(P)-binding domain-containing protein [Dendrothele bispora CBS 962.96]|uniref:FAD/NAD(P)-binding domain-containing protein n=1 Tax=Dendrothele bispora (strain CBS 962.96) TaxID=1314807 RepID=A0A4S8M9J4_DENBC|nr:FAD/NAD(P)-binding domain-containing protein [Dendrothele bispora CBS 962.96]